MNITIDRIEPAQNGGFAAIVRGVLGRETRIVFSPEIVQQIARIFMKALGRP